VSIRSPQTLSHKQVVDKILGNLAEAEQPLPSSLEFYRQILSTQNKIKLPDISTNLATLKKKAPQQLAQGKPLLTFRDLKINWANIQNLFHEITLLTKEHLAPEPEEIEELDEIGADITLLKKTAKTWFGTSTISRKSTSKDKAIKPLTASVFQASFYPLLSLYADELSSLASEDSWYRRYCPVCGGSPDFSFLEKEEGGRYFLCSRCDASWLFYRLVCPYCENDDHSTLNYFTDDKGLYRLYVCEKCHYYLKTIDLRKTESEILLPLERILTLDLDRQAYESKYKTITE